jgi:hypothetical protein
LEEVAASPTVSLIGINVRAGQHPGIVISFFPRRILFVVGVVLSGRLLFGFDQIMPRKEGGTLRLMLANPVPGEPDGGQWLGAS